MADYGEVDHAAEMARAITRQSYTSTYLLPYRSPLFASLHSVDSRLCVYPCASWCLFVASNIVVGKASGKLGALQSKLNKEENAQNGNSKDAGAAKKAEQMANRKRKKDDTQAHMDVDASDADDDDAHAIRMSSQPKKSKSHTVGEQLYAQVKASKAASKEARGAQHTRVARPVGWDEMSEEERRKVTAAISTNRGLVRARPKDRKNPRAANRLRYEHALVRRKGQVQLYTESQAANYGGQATGIKATVTKSIPLR